MSKTTLKCQQNIDFQINDKKIQFDQKMKSKKSIAGFEPASLD